MYVFTQNTQMLYKKYIVADALYKMLFLYVSEVCASY